MRNTKNISNEKTYNRWIVILSIAIPLAVAALFGINLRKLGFNIQPLTFLPPIYATINGITAVVLIAAVIQIKRKNRALHKKLMTFAIVLSVSFLVMYVAYHITSDPTPFGGRGFIRVLYYIILITHVALSVAIIPFVLITYVRGITNNIKKHKAIAKITFPLWLYVAVTGVVVYLMISPYYTQ